MVGITRRGCLLAQCRSMTLEYLLSDDTSGKANAVSLLLRPSQGTGRPFLLQTVLLHSVPFRSFIHRRIRSAACAQMHTPKQFRHARAPEHRKRPQATDLQPSPIPATASSARLRTIRHRRNRRRAFPAPVTGCVPDGPRRLLFIAQESERKCIKMTR